MNDIYKKLTNKNDKVAYEYAKSISVESSKSDKYLKMIPVFAAMLEDESSYIRTRGFMLICSQARWADRDQIKDIYDRMSTLLYDSKPTVVRQCLKALQEVVLFRPELSKTIKKSINKIDINSYKDSMSSLIQKDIDELMKMID